MEAGSDRAESKLVWHKPSWQAFVVPLVNRPSFIMVWLNTQPAYSVWILLPTVKIVFHLRFLPLGGSITYVSHHTEAGVTIEEAL